MRTIRNMAIVMGFSLALFALVAPGASAQVLSRPSFSGTFTLPVQTQWGTVALPAGDYTLHYGHLAMAGPYAVEIVGEGKGGPHSVILTAGKNSVSATKNAITCVRDSGALIVRSLDMPEIGESVSFRLPHGAQLVAHKQIHNGYKQLAQAPMLIQRIPVRPGAK